MEEAPPSALEDPLEVRLSTGTAAALQERASAARPNRVHPVLGS